MDTHVGKSHIRPFIDWSRSLNEVWQAALAAATTVRRWRPDGLFVCRFWILDSITAVTSFTIVLHHPMISWFFPQIASRAYGREL
jgi:hypothetical protein